MKALRVPGHALQHEGAPTSAPSCKLDDCAAAFGVKLTSRYGGITGTGHALCRCGWQGTHAPSGAARKREYRQHLEDAAAEPAGHPADGETPVAVADHTELR